MIKPHDVNLLKTLLYKSHYDDSGYMVYQNHEPSNLLGLTETGFLRPTTPAEFYRCECEYGGGEVYWSHALGQDYAHVHCGCASYRIDPQDIQRWELVFPALLRKIGEAMGFTPPFQEVIPGLAWQFGRRKRRDFYYPRRADFDMRRMLREFFSPHPTAIFIVPTTACFNFIDGLTNPCFAVESIGSMDKSFNLTIDMNPIEVELEPVVNDGDFRQRRRVEKIDRLITALKEHYQLAKDHYYSSEGDILRRPTQADLAKQINTSQDVVSRCLADRKAIVLRTLWDNAENLQAILNR